MLAPQTLPLKSFSKLHENNLGRINILFIELGKQCPACMSTTHLYHLNHFIKYDSEPFIWIILLQRNIFGQDVCITILDRVSLQMTWPVELALLYCSMFFWSSCFVSLQYSYVSPRLHWKTCSTLLCLVFKPILFVRTFISDVASHLFSSLCLIFQ